MLACTLHCKRTALRGWAHTAQVLSSSLAAFPPQQLARLLWALAQFGAPVLPPVLQSALLQRAAGCVSQLQPGLLANMLSALLALGCQPGAALLSAAADAVLATMAGCSIVAIVELMQVFAALHHHPGVPLLHSAAQHVCAQLTMRASALNGGGDGGGGGGDGCSNCMAVGHVTALLSVSVPLMPLLVRLLQ